MTSPSPRYRSASLGDVEAVVQLVESAYRGDSSRLGWTTEADLLDGQRTDREEVTELTRSESARLLLAEQANEIAASQVGARRFPESSLQLSRAGPGVRPVTVATCIGERPEAAQV